MFKYIWPHTASGYFHEMEINIWKVGPTNRYLRNYREDMFQEELVPPKMVDDKDCDEVYRLPEFAHEYDGEDILPESYVAMFLMIRNHLGLVRDCVGTKSKRYRGEVKRVKQIMLVITPNTSVYFPMTSKVFARLGHILGYSANLYDAENPRHFYC